MRLGLFTISIVLSGIFIPVYQASSGIIKSTDGLKTNYEIHHRIIIYNSLSSYRNINDKMPGNEQNIINVPYGADNFFVGKDIESRYLPETKDTKPSRFPISISNLNGIYANSLSTDLLLGHDHENHYQELQVGSFLDNFKNEPLLQTIYFSSKDLMFSYRRKVANILQLGFDMDAKDYKISGRSGEKMSWKNNPNDKERSRKEHLLKQKSGSFSMMVSESYETIFLVILTIFGAIYMSFRYILNKYI
ncbi:MAG: hypothetical protein COB49_02585 [Alphaproteobacteria bacterium]|nr:MAG: hypothetical protein COB49_02585 [Alphaproteobacteria bacterium]